MASIDICYAVAAYNLVSEEHLHFTYIEDFRFRTHADDAKDRIWLERSHREPLEAQTMTLRLKSAFDSASNER